MGIPVEITGLADWRVYGERASWPGAPDHLFIVEAAERILRVKFGLDGDDVADDSWSAGYRNNVANDLSALLTRGSLIAYARAVGDTRMSPIATAWTPVAAYAAVATGIVRRPHGRLKRHPHWVFVGRAEVDILAKVYAASAMLFPPEEAGPIEALGEAVLASLGRMAGNPAATPRDGASAVVQRLLPSSGWTLHPQDRDAFATAIVPWLFRELEADPDCRNGKDELAAIAVAEHAPFMSGRIFDIVWAKAKKIATDKNAPAAIKAHAHRFRPGPKTAP